MTTTRKSADAQDPVISRIEALVQAINDREQILSATKSQVESFAKELETEIREKISQLESKVDNSLATTIKSTSDYTASLYSRFERMVWVGLLLLGGVSAFIGYQTFSSIPEKIRAEIHTVAETHRSDIDSKFKLLEDNLKTRETAIMTAEDRVKSEASDADKLIKDIAETAKKGARERVEQIGVDYAGRFRDFQIDAYIQLLQHQSGETEIVQQLVHAFPNVDSSRQNRIATTLIDFDIPDGEIAAFKASIEAWRPPSDNDVAQATRYQLLIQHRSIAARNEIQEKMKLAIQKLGYSTN
jgi:hypothetical protein